MTIHSGKYGNIEYEVEAGNSDMAAVRNWVVNETQSPFEYAHSATKVGRGRTKGVYDYTGSFEYYGAYPPIMPGDFFNFLGYTAPTAIATDGTGSTLKSITRDEQGHPLHDRMGSIVESIIVNWNFQNGSLINSVINFAQANAVILEEAEEKHVDDETFVPKPVCPTSLQAEVVDDAVAIHDAPTDTALDSWDNIVSANLTINSNNLSYVNSSTGCNTAREPGIVDADLAVVEQSHKRPFTLGEQMHIRIFQDDTLAWNLRGMMYVSRDDFRVDIETGAIIQQTNNFQLKALLDYTDTQADPDEPTTAAGYISRPGEEPAQSPVRNPAWPLPWWPNQYNGLAYS